MRFFIFLLISTFILKSHSAFSCAAIFSDSHSGHSSTHKAQSPSSKTISIIIPVYSELSNGNINRLLKNLSELDTDSLPKEIEVQFVFIVNNTKSTSEEIKDENKKTVDLLNQRLINEYPTEIRLLDTLKSKGIQLIIIDRVYPGFQERKIGVIRNLGFQKAMETASNRDSTQHFIANLDADTTIPRNYLTAIESRFSNNSEVKTILINRQFYIEPGTHSSLYASTYVLRAIDKQKFVIDAMDIRTKDEIINDFGGPQIIVRASELKEVGGIPKIDSGEDILLVNKLWKKGGIFRDMELAVRTGDRARIDGYDAKSRLRNLDPFLKLANGGISIKELLIENFLIDSLSHLTVPEITNPRRVKPLFDFFDIPFDKHIWNESVSKVIQLNRTNLVKKIDWNVIDQIVFKKYLPSISKDHISTHENISFLKRILPWFIKNIPEIEVGTLIEAIKEEIKKDTSETNDIQNQLNALIQTGKTGDLKGRAKEFFNGNIWIEGLISNLRTKGLNNNEIFLEIIAQYPDWFLRIDKTYFRIEAVILSTVTLWIHRVKNNPSDFPQANRFFSTLRQYVSGH